ncbi:MAG: hypothetical protein J07HX64_02349 [halophilic archaeon J07HX64]|jgi:Uncharacterized protein conserved in archaea|nr:MAG: hypothetical protein J07HX64_02349 [halophilic archaeon J07HX64]
MQRAQLKTSVLESTRDTLIGCLSDYDQVVEVGVGREPSVAAGLARAGVAVTATDIHPQEMPPDVVFLIDDITAPERSVYADAGAIYGLNLPPELHRPALELAESVDASLFFTTLGGDPPAVPVTRKTMPAGTLFVADPRG